MFNYISYVIISTALIYFGIRYSLFKKEFKAEVSKLDSFSNNMQFQLEKTIDDFITLLYTKGGNNTLPLRRLSERWNSVRVAGNCSDPKNLVTELQGFGKFLTSSEEDVLVKFTALVNSPGLKLRYEPRSLSEVVRFNLLINSYIIEFNKIKEKLDLLLIHRNLITG